MARPTGREIKHDCFAYRMDYKNNIAECDALNNLNCRNCPFYKNVETVEYYEGTYFGKPMAGYGDKVDVQRTRLLQLRAEIDNQLKALTNER